MEGLPLLSAVLPSQRFRAFVELVAGDDELCATPELVRGAAACGDQVALLLRAVQLGAPPTSQLLEALRGSHAQLLASPTPQSVAVLCRMVKEGLAPTQALLKCRHSVLTEDLINEPGQPTRQALEQVLDFLDERLSTGPRADG